MAGQALDIPTVLVVFGATGDLMERKIVPALLHLHRGGRLPERFRVIGFARRAFPDDEFRARVAGYVRDHAAEQPTSDELAAFLELFTYSQGTLRRRRGVRTPRRGA